MTAISRWSAIEVAKEYQASLPSDANVVEVRVLRDFSTGISRVIEIETCSPSGNHQLFIKIPFGDKPIKSSQAEYQSTIRFRSFFSETREHFDSVEAITVLENSGGLVLASAEGDSLQSIISRGIRWGASRSSLNKGIEAVAKVGAWAAHLTAATTVVETAEFAHDSMGQEYTKAINRISSKESILSEKSLKGISSLLEEEFKGSDVKMSMAHGDLHPDNIFVTNDSPPRITTIDLSLSSLRPFGYDALFFDFHMSCSWNWLQYSPWKIRKIRNAFWNGFGSTADQIPKRRSMELWFLLASLRYIITVGANQSGIRRFVWRRDLNRVSRNIAQVVGHS